MPGGAGEAGVGAEGGAVGGVLTPSGKHQAVAQHMWELVAHVCVLLLLWSLAC